MDLVIVTGKSGAGKSVVLSVLEDQGYYCIDNIPIKLFEQICNLAPNLTKIAISLDIRNLNFGSNFDEIHEYVNRIVEQFNPKIIYLDCLPHIIVSRYADTRRSHPLMSTQAINLEQAIAIEEDQLNFMRELSDLQIDTSSFNVHQLSSRILEFLKLTQDDTKASNGEFKLLFNSFGFKKTSPPSSNFVFDVRHLPNPYWEKNLAKQNGLDQEVIDFFEKHQVCQEEITRISEFLDNWLTELSKTSPRRFAVISIGCTGGMHRSVYVAEKLARLYADRGYSTQSHHFTLNRISTYVS